MVKKKKGISESKRNFLKRKLIINFVFFLIFNVIVLLMSNELKEFISPAILSIALVIQMIVLSIAFCYTAYGVICC